VHEFDIAAGGAFGDLEFVNEMGRALG